MRVPYLVVLGFFTDIDQNSVPYLQLGHCFNWSDAMYLKGGTRQVLFSVLFHSVQSFPQPLGAVSDGHRACCTLLFRSRGRRSFQSTYESSFPPIRVESVSTRRLDGASSESCRERPGSSRM